MTAKYPSIRRRVPASLLTLSFLLMLPGQAAAEEAAHSAAIDEAAAGTAVAAGQADDDVSRGDVIIVTARRRRKPRRKCRSPSRSTRRFDRSDGQLQRREASRRSPRPAILFDQPAQHDGQYPWSRRPFRPDQRRHRAGRRHLCRRCLLFARRRFATFDFLDIDQVEVLRGPQGTLYGKNTTAGAINITTNQPTFDFEGRAELSVGNLNYRQAKAAVSGPLSETIAARLAIAATSRRGTLFNVTSDRWINEQDNLGLRGQLAVQAE
jgi:iron complex outermembrane receptor protein